MSELKDEQIASFVQKGDATAFGELVERFEPKMMRYAKRFLFNIQDAEDVVQEVFLKAYINIKSFDSARRFSPWLYRIAHNEFVNELSKRHRQPVLNFDFDLLFPQPVAKETADDAAHRHDLRRFLDTYLDKISPKYRELLVLYYYEEMDYKEISEILQIPTSTVGVRLARGKAALKKLLSRDNVTYDG